MKYLKFNDILHWLVYDCEEQFNLSRFEIEFEGCLWVPLDYFKDAFTEPTMNKLSREVRSFDEVQIQNI